jgi:hypothetical protein
MELLITHGFFPDHHLVRCDFPSYKNAGDFRFEKLRLVYGVKATENKALKISVAWEIKRIVKQFDDIFYEFQFGHPHQTCLRAIILKELTIGSFILTKTPGIIIYNDSMGAFDRVICGVAMLTLCSIGFASSVAIMIGLTRSKIKCYIKIGFGVSESFYQSTDEKQTFGLGQVSTATTYIWCIIHGILMHTVAT